METKIATTIEQSKKLLELGLDPKSADMFYAMYKDGIKPHNGDENLRHIYQDKQGNWYNLNLYEEYYEEECHKEIGGVYAWSLSALLSLLPLSIPGEKGCRYFLEWNFWNDNSLLYIEPPYSDDRKCLVDIFSDHDEEIKDYIDMAFEMVCYLKENKLI